MSSSKKDKVVLCVPGSQRIQIGAITHLPLALLSLAAWLRTHGDYDGRIRILDANVRRLTASDFSDAAIVGITAMTGSQISYGLEIAALARAGNAETVIVWGGIHPSLLPEQTIQHPLVDVVVVGEGEQTFLEVVNAVFDGTPLTGIPGTCCCDDDGRVVFGPRRSFIDLAQMPLPAYDLIRVGDYPGIEHQFDYQTSRGCPFRCGFCYNTVFCGRRYRKKPAAQVVQEMITLHDRYRITSFGLVDDEFFIDRKRIEAIFDGIIDSGRKLRLIASCRLDIGCRFAPTLLAKMKQAGITQMFFGAESGSEAILNDIKKDITRQQILDGALRVANAGIRPILSFMSGFPGETLADFNLTLDIIQQLWRLHPLISVNGVFPFNAYPGTALYDKALAFGLKTPKSLEAWGRWSFQYQPDNPWLDPFMKRNMEIAFYMVRFTYYIARYEDRYAGRLVSRLLKVATWPLMASVNLRLGRRWFSWAWEWIVFARLVRKTFGYL